MALANLIVSDPATAQRMDRRFLLANVVTAWIGVVLGFGPKLADHATGRTAPAAPFLQLHAAVFLGWLAFVSLQIALIGTGRTAWHRRLGLLGFPLAAGVLAMGLYTAFASTRADTLAGDAHALPFLIQPLGDMVTFSALVGAGLIWRKDRDAHRRLMLLGLIAVVEPGWARSFGHLVRTWMGGDTYLGFIGHQFAAEYGLVAAAVLYDLATRGRVHPVFKVAVPILIVGQFAISAVNHWSGWPPIAYRLVFGA